MNSPFGDAGLDALGWLGEAMKKQEAAVDPRLKAAQAFNALAAEAGRLADRVKALGEKK